MKIALFGGTGTIGKGIMEKALRRGHEVTAVMRKTSRLAAMANRERLHIETGDILVPDTVMM